MTNNQARKGSLERLVLDALGLSCAVAFVVGFTQTWIEMAIGFGVSISIVILIQRHSDTYLDDSSSHDQEALSPVARTVIGGGVFNKHLRKFPATTIAVMIAAIVVVVIATRSVFGA